MTMLLRTRTTENIKLHVHVTTYTLSQSLISLHPTADLPHQLPIYLLPTYDSFTYPRFISPSHMKKEIMEEEIFLSASYPQCPEQQ